MTAHGTDTGTTAAKRTDVRDPHNRLIGLLPAPPRNPYYIVAPPYVRSSAGIRVLHLLCHALNRAGERAYLVVYPYRVPESAINTDLLTPLLTFKMLTADYQRGLTPITVYPEVISGNPFLAPFVVRYALNYPGHLGGDKQFAESDFFLAYGESIRQSVPGARASLFIPASDPYLFTPSPKVQRSGSCFYAGKYKEDHGGRLFDITRDSVEILRQGPGAQTPDEIADLFRQSEVFYCYENSALAIEALLCECPVVLLPNEHFDRVILAEDLGWDGIAWGADAAEVSRARETVSRARQNYMRLYDRFQVQLQSFITLTQTEAASRRYDGPMVVPYLVAPGLLSRVMDLVRIGRALILDAGVLGAVYAVVGRVWRRGFKPLSRTR